VKKRTVAPIEQRDCPKFKYITPNEIGWKKKKTTPNYTNNRDWPINRLRVSLSGNKQLRWH
jgi:hypothetical protein